MRYSRVYRSRALLLILALCFIFTDAAPVSAVRQSTFDVVRRQNPYDVDVTETRRRMDKELAKITQKWERKIPQEAYNPNGTVNKEHPGYKKIEAKWRAEMETARTKYNSSDKRWNKMTEAIEKSGAGGKITNTGSQPKSVKSDIDLTAKDYQSGKKLVKELEGKGFKAKELSDRWVIKKTDTTIWKNPPPETPSAAVSSSAEAGYTHAAKPGSDKFPTEGGMHSTTKGTKGIPDPEGAVLSNVKKASDGGLVGPPKKMDTHTIGKSASKAAEATGTKSGNPEFHGKADGVRNHLTNEEAGVTTFGNSKDVKQKELGKFQVEARTELTKAHQAGQEQSKQLDIERTQKINEARAAGNKTEAVKTRLEQIKTKMSNQATIKELPPELAGELTGKPLTKTTQPDGSIAYKTPEGKSLSPSEARELVTGKAQTEVIKTTNAANEEIKPGAKGMSPGMKAAGVAVLIYGAYEGGKRGGEKAAEEAKPGDSTLKTATKGTIYGIGYATGIPDAWNTGKKAGEDSMNQYEKEKAEGKNPSWGWAKLRGAVKGVGTFVKGMTYDQLVAGAEAVKEGVGVVTDKYVASKAVKQSQEMQERVKEKKERKVKESLEGNLKSGKEVIEAVDSKPTPQGNVDKISDLRGSEAKTSKIDKEKLEKSPEGQKAGMELAQNTKVTDSYDKGRSRESKQKTKEVQDTAGSTQKERGDVSQAEDQREKTKIKGQGEQTDRAISSSQQEHISAEKAAEQARQTSLGTTVAGAVAGGLTSGVATGVDNLAGGVGRGAGQQVSRNLGIQPNTSSQGSSAGSPTSSGSSTSSAGSSTQASTQAIACNTTAKSGTNAPETVAVNVGKGSGTVQFFYNMYNIKDQMIVSYGGQTLFDTGCVSGSKTVPLNISGASEQVIITVRPACAGSSTRWDLRLECPKPSSP